MLVLKDIVKEYETTGEPVKALGGVTLAFRKNEFVSILGHSGCGKTTLLNVVGGLDRYTSGDLVIRGKSTKAYRECDWDTYRNHSIGFIFQSYNLIPHQTVLSNVELALTLSGVSKAERRARAVEVLKRVGLEDQIHKKPNQMSGGQMQRVAIARALINDPEILLADEPTGALDTDTSVQIMELLKEISGDRLIIMVTHNPELAEQYSDRIIRLKDGFIIGDTNPYSLEEEKKEFSVTSDNGEKEANEENITPVAKKRDVKKGKKTSMSFFTALSLSLNNLLTKKGRTFMTSFAGSIGIIGIALILSLSNGIQAYIDKVQQETLSSYPIIIQSETMDMAGLMGALMGSEEEKKNREDGKIYSSTILYDLITTMNNSAISKNNLEKFKNYLDSEGCAIMDYASHVQYSYDVSINAYLKDERNEYFKADISSLFQSMQAQNGASPNGEGASSSSMSQSFSTYSVWQEMLSGENNEFVSQMVKDQYDLLEGDWPKAFNEIVLLIDGNNEVSDITLYSLGLISEEKMMETMIAAMRETGDVKHEATVYEYSDIIGRTYQLIASTDYFKEGSDGLWYDISKTDDLTEFRSVVANGVQLKIVGIIRQNPDVSAGSLSGSLIYTKALTDYLVERVSNSEVVAAQKADENRDIFTGLQFKIPEEEKLNDEQKPDAFRAYVNSLSTQKKAELYRNIITTPTDAYVEATAKSMLQSYGITEETEYEALLETMVSFSAKTEDDKALVRMYLSTFTKNELYDYVVDTFGIYVRDEFKSAAEQEINAIINMPTAGELSAERAIVYFGLLETNQKRMIFNMLANEYASTVTDDRLDSSFAVLARTVALNEASAAQIEGAVLMAVGADAKKAYIVDVYNSSTELPESTVSGYVNGLSDNELATLFVNVVTSEANKYYAADGALNQSEELKNRKLAAKLDEAMPALSDTQIIAYYDAYVHLESSSTLSDNYKLIGKVDKAHPSAITIYADDFESKEIIGDLIKEYNATCENVDDEITYTDYVALLMSSVTTIVNAISYVLIAFVSISLVVSSIMIGIITYISVLERTKEIGILRSIGASRKDISRVFNAETLIVGFVSGAIGIISTLLLNIPINLIIDHLTDIGSVSKLPFLGAVALVCISMLLTVIAGLIPSGLASKKDPVVALRTE